MSTLYKITKDPRTGEWEDALWNDNHFGKNITGVRFPDGTIYNPAEVKLKIRNEFLVDVTMPIPSRYFP